MIKLEDIEYRSETDEEGRRHYRAELRLTCEHIEPRTNLAIGDPEFEAHMESNMRNSLFRLMFEDVVPLVHALGGNSMAYLPTHLQVQHSELMDQLMNIFLGIAPQKKAH